MAASGSSSFLKTILAPLVVAALLYLFISYVLLPLHRRYVRKYQHYLPLAAPASLGQLSSAATGATAPSSLLGRLSGLYVALDARLPFSLPFARSHDGAAYDAADFVLDDGEGEGMIGFSPVENERRREALLRREALERSMRGFRGARVGGRGVLEDVGRGERRLSRDLEEGFRDSSDSEDGDGGRTQR